MNKKDNLFIGLDIGTTKICAIIGEKLADDSIEIIGIGKAPFFAFIIALVGCYQGFQIRGGVDDVGRHTTTSVVQSIFLVIVFDAWCSIVLSWWEL